MANHEIEFEDGLIKALEALARIKGITIIGEDGVDYLKDTIEAILYGNENLYNEIRRFLEKKLDKMFE